MNWSKQVADFKGVLKVEGPSLSAAFIRFGFFGIVGGGKSVTAGIFAVGITPTGAIGWIDGEGKRSTYAIDHVCDMAVKKYGGAKEKWLERFKVIHIDPPFHPLRVVAAIEALEEVGCKTIIADVLSQAWSGDGSYLDLKDADLDRRTANIKDEDAAQAKRESSAQAAAAKVKPWTHEKLVNKVNASKCHMVLLFQAKQKFNPMTHKPNEFVTPIQESGLTRTAIAVGRVECQMVGDEPQGGFCTFRGSIAEGTKSTHPSILKRLPNNGEQFTFAHAEAIAAWVKAPPATNGAPRPASERTNAVKELWSLTESVHQNSKENGKHALTVWLREEQFITAEETLENLSVDRLKEIVSEINKKEAHA